MVAPGRASAEEIVATVREPLLVLDGEHRVVLANRAFYATFRVSPEETEGEPIFALGDGQWNIPGLRKLLDTIIPENKEFEDFEVTHEFPAIGERTMLLNGRQLQREPGEAPLILLAIEDVTERKRAAAEVQRQREVLERSNAELDEFAYIASHDLKEPLRGIANYAGFLLEDYRDRLDEEGRHKLETLTRLSARMEEVIDALLRYSRLGRTELALEEVDLGAIVRAVVDSLQVSLGEEDIEVRLPRPLPRVRCDRARVGEIFRNLMTNAIKYGDKDERWIEIGHDAGAHPPVFYVRDNGIGIRARHRDAVFRMFKRLHGRGKFGGGTGSGLTIARRIVERHGGRIWLESVHGEGTIFYFTLAPGEGTP